jgi:hypothetical protein
MGIGFKQFIGYLIGYHFENNISFNHDMKNNNESFLVQLWFKTW